MKKFFAIIILSLCLTTSSQADDIKDFQIEGVSLGDSLLDFFDKNTILSSKQHNYEDDKFYSLDIMKKFEVYDAIQFQLKKGDNSYKIYGIGGGILFGNASIHYPKSEQECKNKKNIIVNDLKKLFKNATIRNANAVGGMGDYDPDVIRQDTYFTIDDGVVSLQCYTWGKKAKKKYNLFDNLRVNIMSTEFYNWLTTKAY